MRDFVPVPGSTVARLLTAAWTAFEAHGFDGVGVVEIAAAAGVTTGSLYHHFGSKLGLFQAIRREVERRMRDRMEGAYAATGGGRAGTVSALLVGYDAAVKFAAVRILSETPVGASEDTLRLTLVELTLPAAEPAGDVMLGAWRAALAAVAAGTSVEAARAALAWALGAEPVTSPRGA